MTTNVLFRQIFFTCFVLTNSHVSFSYFVFLNSNTTWKEFHIVMHFQSSFATLNVNFVGARSTDIAAVQFEKL